MNRNARGAAVVAASAAVLVASAALAMAWGAVTIPLPRVIQALAGAGPDDTAARIVRAVRLPRTVMGASVGALLGVAGAVMQGFLANPLAEPYILGISSGAALAVAVAVLSGAPLFLAGIYVLPLAAFAGALVTLAAVYSLARAGGRVRAPTLILAGVIAGSFLSACLMAAATAMDRRYFEILSWLLGHLQPATAGTERWVAGYTVLGVLASMACARDLNALQIGEEAAAALGVRAEAAVRRLFVISSLLTAVAVASAGPVGFVGLVAPHAARLLGGPDHRWLIPASACCGGALILLADLAGRMVFAPAELPVGVVTALLGGPFFLLLLVRHTRKVEGRG